jgi:hypothetical protein
MFIMWLGNSIRRSLAPPLLMDMAILSQLAPSIDHCIDDDLIRVPISVDLTPSQMDTSPQLEKSLYIPLTNHP